MNSCIDVILTFLKVFAAVCCGCNTIDIYKEEMKEYYRPINEEQKLIYHKNKLKNICLNILDNKDNKNYEIVFEYNKIKIDLNQIIENIDNLNIENIIQLKKKIVDYYETQHNKIFTI
ncbi:MAG: hypothetical protein U9532_02710 ['Conium maculatum' witches'-broom phytoplasma]|nr:hypothetical protein ['Conium maculatum' witches'-broom phytoplasma]